MFYTLVILALGIAFAQNGSAEIGNFSYFERSDPITDANDSCITALETGAEYDRAQLFFGCNDGAFSTYVSTSGFLGIGKTVSVIYRFDNKEPSKLMEWNPSSDGEAAFVPSELRAFWVKQVRTSEKLAVRMKSYSGEELTHIFNLNGSSGALDRLPCAPDR